MRLEKESRKRTQVLGGCPRRTGKRSRALLSWTTTCEFNSRIFPAYAFFFWNPPANLFRFRRVLERERVENALLVFFSVLFLFFLLSHQRRATTSNHIYCWPWRSRAFLAEINQLKHVRSPWSAEIWDWRLGGKSR